MGGFMVERWFRVQGFRVQGFRGLEFRGLGFIKGLGVQGLGLPKCPNRNRNRSPALETLPYLQGTLDPNSYKTHKAAYFRLYHIGALIIRIGFWGPLHHSYDTEPLRFMIGNYFGPYIKYVGPLAQCPRRQRPPKGSALRTLRSAYPRRFIQAPY